MIVYSSSDGTDYLGGDGNVRVYLGSASASSTQWRRFERDVADDWTRVTGGASSWQNTDGVLFRPSWHASYDLWIDDIRLSNAMTVEQNTLGTGAIGHILRHRTIDVPGAGGAGYTRRPTAGSIYDQVGSVLTQTDSSGTVMATNWQDAFGNQLQSWSTGLWSDSTSQSGWHHNTKEYDADAGLVYMHQRWYSNNLGLFGSEAPNPPMIEHPYSFAENIPISGIDPKGKSSYLGERCTKIHYYDRWNAHIVSLWLRR
jgi:RHS repeat-associated protein